eukprot:gene12631-20539_t
MVLSLQEHGSPSVSLQEHGSPSVSLQEHGSPSAADGSDVTTISVHIVDGEGMPVPHGMELDRDTMQLLNCAEDSATGHNSKVCACIGMVLAEVRTPEEAEAAVEDHDTLDSEWIPLSFRPARAPEK